MVGRHQPDPGRLRAEEKERGKERGKERETEGNRAGTSNPPPTQPSLSGLTLCWPMDGAVRGDHCDPDPALHSAKKGTWPSPCGNFLHHSREREESLTVSPEGTRSAYEFVVQSLSHI